MPCGGERADLFGDFLLDGGGNCGAIEDFWHSIAPRIHRIAFGAQAEAVGVMERRSCDGRAKSIWQADMRSALRRIASGSSHRACDLISHTALISASL